MKIKINEILKIIIWPFLFWIGQIAIIMVFTLFYQMEQGVNSHNIDSIQLANFLNDYKLIISLVSLLIFSPIFNKEVKKFQKNNKSEVKYFKMIIIAVLLSVLINFTFYSINKIFNISNLYKDTIIKQSLIINLITIGIIGPILEEYLFRGIVYNKLKLNLNLKYSRLVGSLIFAVSHSSFFNIIGAFILGYFLIHYYEKTDNLKYPIIFHIIYNITSLVIFSII